VDRRFFIFFITLIFLVSFCNAADVDLKYPADGEGCIAGDIVNYSYVPNEASITTCFFYTNFSGSWVNSLVDYSPTVAANNYFSDSTVSPGVILWGVSCSNSTNTYFSSNASYTLTDAPYCAFLVNTSCKSKPALNSESIIKTRLGNSKKFWLEHQDCNVWIENQNGETVKKFNSMMVSAETSIQLDSNGNYINTAAKSDVVLTDSQGWYLYPFKVDGAWAFVDDNYSVHTTCNGQHVSCNFQVQREELPDMKNYEQLGKEGSGIILIVLILIFALVMIWRRIRR
jgi:hypothetical protein